MTVLDRLKLELANKRYFSDVEYQIFLDENDLKHMAEYQQTDKRAILTAVYDVLQALANNIELYCKIETEFSTNTEAIKNLEKRIANIRGRITAIDVENGTEQMSSNFSFMYRG